MVLRPRRVLIVGGGPCGLVTLRNLLERGEFEDVQLVERRDNIGGVWYQPPACGSERDDGAHSARADLKHHGDGDDDDDHPSHARWPSPTYPGLIGNVVPEFLTFSGWPFPPPPRADQPFPTLVETYDYLAAFARPLFARGRIRLGHEVVDVAEANGGWRVVMMDWNRGGEGVRKEERWDAVVITTVWYDNGHYPTVDGLDDVRRETGRVRHAKTWRGPSGYYEGKRVVVIGNANSANEMAAQLAPVARPPVYRSTRRVSIFPSLPDDRIQDVGPVVRYSRSSTRDDAKIVVHLQDGGTIDDVDHVLFGTGYYPDVPYLRVLHQVDPGAGTTTTTTTTPDLPSSNPLCPSLVPLTDRTRVQPARVPMLYRHILYAHNPSLAFIGALISFTPFAMADLTSTWLARVWAPPTQQPRAIDIPSTPATRLADEQARLHALFHLRAQASASVSASASAPASTPSDLLSYHFLGHHSELSYAQTIRGEIVHVAPHLGEMLAPWDEAQDERRFAMYGAKLASLYVLAGREKP